MERGAMTQGRAGYETPATSEEQTPSPGSSTPSMKQAPSTKDKSKMDTQSSGAKRRND